MSTTPLSVGDECPQCGNGTLDAGEGELRCAGECGSIFPAPANVYTTASAAHDVQGAEAWLAFHGTTTVGIPLPVEVRCVFVPAGSVQRARERYRAVGHLAFGHAEWRRLCEQGLAFEGPGEAALRQRIAAIPVTQRCHARCPTWIVCDSGLRGLEIQACDDCWSGEPHGKLGQRRGAGKPCDAELLALPEARDALRVARAKDEAEAAHGA